MTPNHQYSKKVPESLMHYSNRLVQIIGSNVDKNSFQSVEYKFQEAMGFTINAALIKENLEIGSGLIFHKGTVLTSTCVLKTILRKSEKIYVIHEKNKYEVRAITLAGSKPSNIDEKTKEALLNSQEGCCFLHLNKATPITARAALLTPQKVELSEGGALYTLSLIDDITTIHYADSKVEDMSFMRCNFPFRKEVLGAPVFAKYGKDMVVIGVLSFISENQEYDQVTLQSVILPYAF